MTKPTKRAGREADSAVLKHVDRCAVFLIKTLCLDTNATQASITQTITHYGKRVGRYCITIETI
jgi:hypothetical protein